MLLTKFASAFYLKPYRFGFLDVIIEMKVGTGIEVVSSLNSSTFFLFLFSLLLSQHRCAEIYNITLSQPLSQEQTLVSPGLIFELGFFTANQFTKYVGIWHKNISPRKVVWVANRDKPIAASDTLASLTFSSNGNLELVDGKHNSIWSTNISEPSDTPAAVLLDSGNFVVKVKIGSDDQLWQSFDYPSDTLLPSMLLGFDAKSRKKNVLTAWRSQSDPSPGMFLVGLTPEVPSQIVIWINESTPFWRSGPWDKSKFIGIPTMNDGYQSGNNLVDDAKKGTMYFSYRFVDNTVGYIEISSEGRLKVMYSVHGENWNIDWVSQRNPCENYGECGPFGVCKASDSSRSPICNCLPGFVPQSLEEWSKGNRTGGCVRKTKMFCESNNTKSAASKGKRFGFLKVAGVKVSDFHEYVPSLDAKECMIHCLNNCSCLAYAYVNNIGCLVWSKGLVDIQEFSSSGDDLFIHLELSETGTRIKLIASLTAMGFISILGAIMFGLYKLRANRRGNVKIATRFFKLTGTTENSRDNLQEYIGKHEPSDLFVYNFNSILIATNNFSIVNKLGEGGFGSVYKGKLEDGKEIAVKRLSSSSGQGIDEFKNEMLLIYKLQHKNLVKVMGCCVKGDEKLLIYEFMPNRSLDTLLFDPTRRAELNWARRFNIIQGVARGLLYLHYDSCLKVIHRDLKVSNILLDGRMNSKISDFGLARIVEGTDSLANTQKVVGTLGYMSPEYAMGGIFSEKSDVYSFGVLLLEIISGRKNTSFFNNDLQLGFLAYVWHSWNDGKGLHLVDEVLADSFSSSEVMRCIHIGLLCVQDKAADRPAMSDVVFMLSSEIDLPKPEQPMFTFQTKGSSDPRPQHDNIFSRNEATITTIEGR